MPLAAKGETAQAVSPKKIMSNIEIVEVQNVIIKLQSEVINELFQQIMNYISVEEADSMPIIKKINHAAELRKEIEM